MDRAEFIRRAAFTTAAVVTPPGLAALTPEEALASPGDKIIRVGERHLGVPYHRMDCSEFTRRVYGRAVDVWMPADWHVQDQYGYRPRKKRPGDLLVFHGHVGIYHSSGRVLHSSSYFGEVVVSNLRALVRDIGRYKVRRIR